MKSLKLATVFAAGLVAGCVVAGTQLPAQGPAPGSNGLGGSAYPLIIDRTDLRIGTTAQFDRMPTASDINDLRQLRALAHVVLSLPEWPTDFTQLSVLTQVPPESDIIVVLPGYPPSRSAADAWNFLETRVRVVMLVTEPPRHYDILQELNEMRNLERVIAQTDDLSRTGFERLQRPLSFRRLLK